MARLLDLFCGAGGAAMGYHMAGFDVVGVDINPQPHYPFEFHQADAMTYPLDGFDAIHASPPCQGYSTMNNRWGSQSPRLIAPVRDRLGASGLPWVIENVHGARSALRNPIRLTGEMFGLGTHRSRLFETSFPLEQPTVPPRNPSAAAIYGKDDGRRLWTRKDGSELRVASLETARAAMEMPWADWHGVKEAIPPAYTKWIGDQLMALLLAKAA